MQSWKSHGQDTRTEEVVNTVPRFFSEPSSWWWCRHWQLCVLSTGCSLHVQKISWQNMASHDFTTQSINTWDQKLMWWGWYVTQLARPSDGHAADAGLIPRCSKEFSSESQLSVQTLFWSLYNLCAITCINIYAPNKDPVVNVQVRWIMATQTYPARTINNKNNQPDDCGHSSTISMLLQHGYMSLCQKFILSIHGHLNCMVASIRSLHWSGINTNEKIKD